MIYLKLLKNPWAIGVLSVILVGGVQQARVWKAQAEASSAQKNEVRLMFQLSKERQSWAEAKAAGEKAARAAVEAAIARERESYAQRKADEEAALERLREAAEQAAREAGEWRRRYREAVEQDATCRAWAETEVACPL